MFRWLLLLIIFYLPGYSALKAVLFDCDGTLVDSEYAHYSAWKHVVDCHGREFTLEDYYPYVGNAGDKTSRLIAEYVGCDSPELLLQQKREYFKELCESGLPPISSTVQFLKKLAAEKETLGIKIGVCSAARKEALQTHLRHLEIEPLLDLVVSGVDDLKDYVDPEGTNKPKPYIYQHAMKILGVHPDETIVIEDSAPGVMAGVSAGCFTIAIPNEFTKGQQFEQADLIVDSFEQMEIDNLLQISPR